MFKTTNVPSLLILYHRFNNTSELSVLSLRQMTSSGTIFLSAMILNCSRVCGKLSKIQPPALGKLKKEIKRTVTIQWYN